MSVFLNEVVHHLRMEPEREVWLLCPSLSVGEQWLSNVIKLDSDIRLPRLATIWHVAIELAEPALMQQQLKVLLPDEIEGLIWELCLRDKKSHTPREIQGLQQTILELRLAGVESADLEWRAFDTKEKGQTIQRLLLAYEKRLKQQKLADPAVVFNLARDRLIQEEIKELHPLFPQSPCPFVLLIPDDVHLMGLAQSLLDQLPDKNRRVVATSNGERSVRMQFLRALESRFEVRALLGTLLQQKVPFDQAEILYPGDHFYPQLILETLTMFTELQAPGTDPPCTFGGGVPVAWTKTGKALRLWLSWIQNNFRSQELLELIIQQLVRLPQKLSAPKVIKSVRSLSAFDGREAWKQRLLIRCQSPFATAEEQTLWLMIKEYVERLLVLVSDRELSATAAWQAAKTFLQSYCVSQTHWDQTAQKRCLQLIERLKTKLICNAELVWERLQNWIDADLLPPESPRPGCLHIAPLTEGGHSGRGWTFIVGMGEDAFSSLPRSSSLLSDRERKELSPELARQIHRELLQEQESTFDRLMNRLQGEVIFIYPCSDQIEGCELFPNYKLLQRYRIQENIPDGNLRAFERSLPAPIGPDSPLVHLTAQERHLSKSPKQDLQNDSLAAEFPHLFRGSKAAEERRQVFLTPFDGYVPAAGAEFAANPTAHPFSSYSLQTLAKCSLQFFYSNVLQLAQPEDLVAQPGEWLNPLKRGLILHAVFHDYHLRLTEEKRPPRLPEDQTLIEAILEQTLQTYAHRLTTVSRQIEEIEKERLTETLHIFLKEEMKLFGKYRPEYFETRFGSAGDKSECTEIETKEPIPLQLLSGRTLYVQGRVDRIDRVVESGIGANGQGPFGPHRYFVWDYKTGGIDEYLGEGPMLTGQLLQPILYQMIVEKGLRETIDPRARVEGFGYFFLGSRGLGDRLIWSSEELQRYIPVLDRIIDVIERGTFLGTEDESMCERCDYQLACDLNRVNRQVKSKLDNEDNTALKPLRSLRQGETIEKD